ncbi:MAG: DNA gyrase subunit A [marine benthic group bacterium]|jgi:DNA gyrase subunit A|nr:DNA gyrase subunit A [Gemmatimonadota bacterium]MCL7963336.1 DNA gyrase subunit A [Candidatus Carthagonibacter metallireducens]MCL7964167.1 DNA gyrase subunit A [Gemmatimonadota bacterium]MCL7967010.1 DNA gyrase subunit A [Gemmatimonadota bacterium]MCL7968610.1 DNA gyrase subunit A [Gemmatimonadota bacterium]
MEIEERTERIELRLLEDEMRESFIDYSMSVIVQRALPDVRDGLKPVHRRILYAMHELGLAPNRPYKKCATVVGDVLGKYHPHGDSAVYDSLVRMVQDFSLRYPLVDGQGNFGSIDGDSAAAYRYTESRLAPLATEMLSDIDRSTVSFVPNFDDRLEEPVVLPSLPPNLLINGSSGIAVGMATNIPPHNLREVVAAIDLLIRDPEATIEDLMEHVRGPDFPTAGLVYGLDGIRDAYTEGRGRVVIRARAHFEERPSGGDRIVVTEIPFMVNKSRLIEQIAQLVRDRRTEDIADLRDESDRDGIRVVIDLKRDAIPQIVLNQLFKHTQMQSTFGVIMLALVDGVPKVMDLKEILQHFIDHRHLVIVRRSEHDLAAAKSREHILQGFKIAVDNIDEVVAIIRGSDDAPQAAERLIARFDLSQEQADAILGMRLSRLTGLEHLKLEEELREVRVTIEDLEELLGSRELRMQLIRDELGQFVDKFGDDRRTEIVGMAASFRAEDLIADEEMVITISHEGYIKRIPPDTYRQQRRGGRGIAGMSTKEEDWVEHLFLAHTHDYLLVITARGQLYWLKVHQIPPASRVSRGKPIVNLLNIEKDEQIASIVRVREFSEDQNLFFATQNGLVKKTSLSAYGNVRSVGINAINIVDDDRLIDVQLTEGDNDVLLATRNGKSIRFTESDAREMGRATRGVRGISLAKGDAVVGMVVVRREGSVLTVSRLGMGKRTPVDEYRVQRRGGKGLINLRLTPKTGEVIAVKEVTDDDELMLVTRAGVINRQHASEIRVIGRNTQGVRLVSLDEGDEVVDVARILVDLSDVDSEGGEILAGSPEADPDVGEHAATERAES